MTFVALSSLAEGADRMVADAVLATEGGTLEVELPLVAHEYAKDFVTERSRDEFDALLASATSVRAPEAEVADADQAWDAESWNASYERAGRTVVDECDVLLAVWDGKPAAGRGGTAEIVAYALRRRVPVVAIPTRGGPLEVDLGETDVPTGIFSVCGVDRTSLRSQDAVEGDGLRPFEVTRASQRELEHYNRTALGLRDLRDERFARAVADERNRLPLADLNSLGLDDLAAWILPYYVRADRTARAYQRWYYGLVTIEFVAAALAVLVVAAVSQLWRRHGRLIAIEMVLLILVVAVVYLGRHLRLNRRWLTSRFLAERFRSALFLKAAGLGAWHEPDVRVPGEEDPTEVWMERAHGFVWSARPRVDVPAARGASIRDFLVSTWIEPQIDYHSGQAAKHGRRARRLTGLSMALFGLTFLVATVHLLNLGEHSATGEWVVAASIALPAFGSAVAGIAAHRQYQRSSTVHRSMARQLRRLEELMVRAMRLPDVQRLATEAASTMVKETRDWLGVMKFSDFEISS